MQMLLITADGCLVMDPLVCIYFLHANKSIIVNKKKRPYCHDKVQFSGFDVCVPTSRAFISRKGELYMQVMVKVDIDGQSEEI